jgi:hypothetical protein
MWDAPHQCFLETPSAVRYVYSLYPEAAKLKILVEVETILQSAAESGRLENIRLAHSYSREHIGKVYLIPPPTFVKSVAPQERNAVRVAMTVRFLSSIILLSCEAFKLC